MFRKYHFIGKEILILYLLFLWGNADLSGQGFAGTAIVGGNLSQIDGDNLYGYNKLGLSVGGRLSYKTEKSYGMSLEMLYSQRGSSLIVFNALPTDKIVLNYFEFPLIFSLNDWYIDDPGYYKVRIEGGLSYGYLFGIAAPGYEENFFKKHDVSWLLAGGFNISKRIGFSIRYTSSLYRMYDDPSAAQSLLLGYFLTLRSEFTF